MNQKLGARTSTAWLGSLAPIVLVVSGGGVLWSSIARQPALGATVHSTDDADADGLVYEQEHVLGTSSNASDTDADGFSDLEEVARKSSPISMGSTPAVAQALSVGMTIHAESDGLHALIALYMTDHDARNKSLTLGYYAHNHIVMMSNGYIAAHASLRMLPAANASSSIALIDLSIDPSLVVALGDVTLFAMAAPPGAGQITTAASVHLVAIGGTPVYCMPNPRLPQSSVSGVSIPAGSGSIYVPLIPQVNGGGTGGGGGSNGAPASWAAGEVCFQRAAPIGISGAVITNEIIAADCVGGWDGFCPPSCSSTVGSTYKTVDPIALIGG